MIIIGAGNQGSAADHPRSDKVISFAHAIKDHPGFDLLGFIDKDLSKSEEAKRTWSAKFSIDNFSAIQYKDVVIVATPDETHYDILKRIANKKLDLVICEKPLCNTVAEAREIVKLYNEKGIPLMVNYTRRFLPFYDHLKSYGKCLYGTCVFNRGWIHTATHAIDFFNMFGCTDYDIKEFIKEKRHWYIGLSFANGETFVESRIDDEPVWDYYDKSHWHIMENAFNFLQGKEQLKCTGEDALKALEKCYELMGKANEPI